MHSMWAAAMRDGFGVQRPFFIHVFSSNSCSSVSSLPVGRPVFDAIR